MIDLGTLGGATSIANGINDDDVVVGESAGGADISHASHAFMWTRHNGIVDLGVLTGGSSSAAQAVSDEGIIVGASQTTTGASGDNKINHAFVWTHRTGMIDIGTDGDARGTDVVSLGEKINGRFVIGHFTKSGVTHGFVWTQKRGLVDIGTLKGDTKSVVAGVNDRGMVVGSSSMDGKMPRAFVWTPSSRIAAMLPTPDGRSSHANAITGDFIVGAICDANGVTNCQATLWKPSSPSHGGRERDDDDED
jgi:probable HAF family extracellular repeat protein